MTNFETRSGPKVPQKQHTKARTTASYSQMLSSFFVSDSETAQCPNMSKAKVARENAKALTQQGSRVSLRSNMFQQGCRPPYKASTTRPSSGPPKTLPPLAGSPLPSFSAWSEHCPHWFGGVRWLHPTCTPACNWHLHHCDKPPGTTQIE